MRCDFSKVRVKLGSTTSRTIGRKPFRPKLHYTEFRNNIATMRENSIQEDNLNAANKPKPKATRPKPVYVWTTQDVLKWFRRHCSDFHDAYHELLSQHGICGKVLLRMNGLSLERLGIHNAEHREEIWRQITKLRLKSDILEMKDIERRWGLD